MSICGSDGWYLTPRKGAAIRCSASYSVFFGRMPYHKRITGAGAKLLLLQRETGVDHVFSLVSHSDACDTDWNGDERRVGKI